MGLYLFVINTRARVTHTHIEKLVGGMTAINFQA